MIQYGISKVIVALLCSSLLCIIAVLLALDNAQPDVFQYVYILPLVFSLLSFAFIMATPSDYYKNVGVVIVSLQFVIRCAITPLFMYFGDYRSHFAINSSKDICSAVFLMLYEALWCFAAVHIGMRKKNAKRSALQKKQISSHKLGIILGLLTAICVLLWVLIPAVRDSYRSFSEMMLSKTKDNPYDYREIVTSGSLARIGATLFTFLFSFLRYLVPAYIIINLYKRKKSMASFIISLGLVALQFLFVPKAVAAALFAACIFLILIIDLYPERRKITSILAGIVAFGASILTFSLTYIKASSWYGVENIWQYLSRLLNGYFTGVSNVASIFWMPDRNKFEILLNSLIGALPFRNTIFPSALEKDTVYTLFTSLPGMGAQIVSTIGCGQYLFGGLFSPTFSFIFVYAAVRFGRKYQATQNYWKKIAYLYMSVISALGVGMYNMPITLINWVQVGIPMLMIAHFAGKDNVKGSEDYLQSGI